MNKQELFNLKCSVPDKEISKNIKDKWDSISKPLDGFGEFETLIAKIGGICGQENFQSLKKALVIMCADNGIVSEGVSQCGQENTLLVARLLGQNKSTASTLAAFAGADCVTIDVGINSRELIPGVIDKKIALGTNNFAEQKAMSQEEAIKAIEVGILAVKDLSQKGYNLIGAGEMGIGNTTTGSALLCALTGLDPEEIVGRGAGLDDKGLMKKKIVIKNALKKYDLNKALDDKEYVLNALCSVGGLDIAAMTGLYLGGGKYKVPIVIDGLISAVAAMTAAKLMPECKEFFIPSHAGREAGVKKVLNYLNLSPLIGGSMALGEGTGALMLFPLLDMMLDFFNKATTFEEGQIDQYTRF